MYMGIFEEMLFQSQGYFLLSATPQTLLMVTRDSSTSHKPSITAAPYTLKLYNWATTTLVNNDTSLVESRHRTMVVSIIFLQKNLLLSVSKNELLLQTLCQVCCTTWVCAGPACMPVCPAWDSYITLCSVTLMGRYSYVTISELQNIGLHKSPSPSELQYIGLHKSPSPSELQYIGLHKSPSLSELQYTL